MFWPSPQDYAEAVQSPLLSFADSELQAGQVELNNLGLPRCRSGAFATVFCFQCPSRKLAVRCFLSNIKDQEERYAEISKFTLTDDLTYTVGFEYIKKGIRIRDEWYPILKMDWVEGQTLGAYLSAHIGQPELIGVLAGYFKQMTLDLKRAGIAHGDLQHDNIMISENELRLVDYDGMYVPTLCEHNACELGHVNYQNPMRGARDFDASLDNFSAWVVFASLNCLSIDPGLWDQLGCGNDCLLFRKADYLSPETSMAFAILLAHKNERVRRFATVMRMLTSKPMAEIPSLAVMLQDSVDVDSLKRSQTSSFEPHSADRGGQLDSPRTGEELKPQGRSTTAFSTAFARDEPQPRLVVTPSQVADAGASAAGNKQLSTSAPSSKSSPSASSTNTKSVPGAAPNQLSSFWTPDPYYASLSRLVIQPVQKGQSPTIDIVRELNPQLLPGERVTWASDWRPVNVCPPRWRISLLVNLSLLFLFLFLIITVSPLCVFALLLLASLQMVPQSVGKVFLVTDRRLVVANVGKQVTLYSVPLTEIAGATVTDIYTIVKAKSEFQIPGGPVKGILIDSPQRLGFHTVLPPTVKIVKS